MRFSLKITEESTLKFKSKELALEAAFRLAPEKNWIILYLGEERYRVKKRDNFITFRKI